MYPVIRTYISRRPQCPYIRIGIGWTIYLVIACIIDQQIQITAVYGEIIVDICCQGAIYCRYSSNCITLRLIEISRSKTPCGRSLSLVQENGMAPNAIIIDVISAFFISVLFAMN